MRIIHTATDRSFSHTQTLVFTHAFPGAEVVGALTEEEVTKACMDNEIDIFVITASLPSAQKLRFEKALRVSCPRAKLIEIFYFSPVTHADIAFDFRQGPAELVRQMRVAMADPLQEKRAM
jgi:hypothetical protein